MNTRFVFLCINILFIFIYLLLSMSGTVDVINFGSDESFYYNGIIYLKESMAQGGSLLDSLYGYTWDYKYWGFIGLAYIITPNNLAEPYNIVFLKFILSVLYVGFCLHVIKRCSVEEQSINVLFMLLLLPFCWFLSVELYRDGILGVLLYLIFTCFIQKKYVLMLLVSASMLLLRGEFVAVLFAGLFLSLLLSVFRFSNVFSLLLSFAIALVLPYFIGHHRYELSNVILLPLSFNGTSSIQTILLYLSGDSYYQDNIMAFIGLLSVTLGNIIFNTLLISLIVGFCKLNNIKSEVKVLINSFLFFYLSVISFYTFINDGFQERVRVAFFPLLALVFFQYYVNSDNQSRDRVYIYISFLISILLHFSVAIRNTRWIFL